VSGDSPNSIMTLYPLKVYVSSPQHRIVFWFVLPHQIFLEILFFQIFVGLHTVLKLSLKYLVTKSSICAGNYFFDVALRNPTNFSKLCMPNCSLQSMMTSIVQNLSCVQGYLTFPPHTLSHHSC